MSNEGIFVFCILDAPQGSQGYDPTFVMPGPAEHDDGMSCYFIQAATRV